MKRTYQPSVVRRKRTHGFLARSRTRKRRRYSCSSRQGSSSYRRLSSELFRFRPSHRLLLGKEYSAVFANRRGAAGRLSCITGRLQLAQTLTLNPKPWLEICPHVSVW